jgi:hypothetical protein
MKTGCHEYYIPSPSTVSHDVKLVFINVRKCIAKMLQTYDGELNFAMDTCTSPNHKAFVAISVHLEHEGKPLAMLLDIVEVAKVSIHARAENQNKPYFLSSHTLDSILLKCLQKFYKTLE